jgi:hypothetical protein
MPPAFPVDEYYERMGRARAALAYARLSGCIASAPEHLYYFGGYGAHTHFNWDSPGGSSQSWILVSR